MLTPIFLLAISNAPFPGPQGAEQLEPHGPVPDRAVCEWLDARIRGRIDLRELGTGGQPVSLVEFDAAEWVSLFEKAGAASLHVTAENYSGYRFWSSDPEVPGVSASTAGADPVKELHAACAAAGMDFGVELRAGRA